MINNRTTAEKRAVYVPSVRTNQLHTDHGELLIFGSIDLSEIKSAKGVITKTVVQAEVVQKN